ncbi:hypothetical protein [Alteribacillus bidgolensis]|uniref:Uncharacterized protein n=1 Tax=Alteribacillus bidgolensis TaxID=930129 RepID=A0A1G8LCL7_9BACI|nr:hypothetical protein [Alteribacillus bidgolensis]SDI53454.1 hypothetical protein SAMN05216352_108239 [Alteribacillus bidgolensis]
MSKQKYYVNLNPISMDDVSPVKIPDSTLIQYEIEATPEELEQLDTLLNETQDHDMEIRNLFSFRHFDESMTETDQHEYQHGMDKIFDMLYELGTPETKKQIKELHMQNHEPKRNMRNNKH